MARQQKSAAEQEIEDFQKGMEMGKKMSGQRRPAPSLLGSGTRLGPVDNSQQNYAPVANVNEGAGVGGSTGRAVSFDKAHGMLMNELISRGVKPEVAAGAVGSMMGESGRTLDPTTYNPKDVNGPSGGFAQWHDITGKGGRFTNLLNFAGMSPSQAVQGGKMTIPLETQIKFLGHELDTNANHRNVLQQLQRGSTVADGNRIWTHDFEVPKDKVGQTAARQRYGDSLWKQWSTNQGALPATATPGSSPANPQNRDAGTPNHPRQTAAADAGTMSDASNDIRRPTAIPESASATNPPPLTQPTSTPPTGGATPTAAPTPTPPAPATPPTGGDVPVPPKRSAELGNPGGGTPSQFGPGGDWHNGMPQPGDANWHPGMAAPNSGATSGQTAGQPAGAPAGQPGAGGMDPLTSFLNDIFGPDSEAAASAEQASGPTAAEGGEAGGGDLLGDMGSALEGVGDSIGGALDGIGGAIGGMFGFAEGGMVPDAPPQGEAPQEAAPQQQGGAPLSAAITGALMGLEKVYGLKKPEGGAVSEHEDPSQRSAVKAFMNNEKGISQEALGALLDQVGDAGQTRDPNAAALQQIYSFYAQKGDKEAADKAAAGVVQAMRQRSMDFGKQAMQSLQQRDFQGAAASLIDAYNEVPDGRQVTGEVNASGVGQASILDGQTGKPVQQIPLNPQYLAMAAQAFATGSEFYNHLAQFAQNPETGEAMNQPAPDDAPPAEQALPVEEMGAA